MGNIFKNKDELQLIKIVKEENAHPAYMVKYAREVLYSNYKNLIFTIARKFVTNELELQDLVSEGVRGLWIAINKYNANSGNKLTTYAFWWITEAIRRSIDKYDRMVKVPNSVKQDKKALKNAREEFYEENGYYPSKAELAKHLGWKENKVTKINSYATCVGSLDKIINDDSNRVTSFEDMTKDENDNAQDAYIKNEQQSELAIALKRVLNAQEYETLAMQCGFNGQEKMSIGDIAKQMHKSPARIKQVLKQAKDKIENSDELK